MKRAILATLALLILALVVPVKSDAGVVRIEKYIFSSYQASNTSCDSAAMVPMKFVNPTVPRAPHIELADAIPDSIRVAWYTTSDSANIVGDTIKVLISLQGHQFNAPLVNTVLDTIKVHGSRSITVSGGTIASYDEFGVKLTGYTGNAVALKNKYRIFMRIECFFHE
jgi:hypothetical protein